MTLALKWGTDNTTDLAGSTSGFVYFDAVATYTTSYTGQVTKHPVDSGGNISDHFIVDNPKFTISAVISSEDISTSGGGTGLIADEDGNVPFNVSLAPSEVSVNSTDQSVLRQFIPDSIGQFLSDSKPTVVTDDARQSQIEAIKSLLLRLVYNRANDDSFIDNRIHLLKIYEFEGLVAKRVNTDIVMTSIVFREDVNTGDGLFCDMNFEKVSFSFLRKTTIPKNILASLNKKASDKSTKSKVTGKENTNPDTPPQNDRDPARGKTSYGSTVDQENFRLGNPVSTGTL